MKTWDIVDRVYPGLHITETLSNPRQISGGVSSKMQVALAVSFLVASSAQFILPYLGHAGVDKAKISISRTEPEKQTATEGVRGRGVHVDVDTQFGQSTPRLAKLFPVYMEPVANEDEYEEDYSFS